MISYITEVTLCLLGFYLLYVFWLSKLTFFTANRWYLMGTLLTSLSIPLLEMPNFASQISNGLTTFYIEPITITVQSLETTLEEIVITPKENEFDIDLSKLSLLIGLRYCSWGSSCPVEFFLLVF